jgi:hypothetical protein
VGVCRDDYLVLDLCYFEGGEEGVCDAYAAEEGSGRGYAMNELATNYAL